VCCGRRSSGNSWSLDASVQWVHTAGHEREAEFIFREEWGTRILLEELRETQRAKEDYTAAVNWTLEEYWETCSCYWRLMLPFLNSLRSVWGFNKRWETRLLSPITGGKVRYSVHSLHYTHDYYTYVKLQLITLTLNCNFIRPFCLQVTKRIFFQMLLNRLLLCSNSNTHQLGMMFVKCSVVSGPQKSTDRITDIDWELKMLKQMLICYKSKKNNKQCAYNNAKYTALQTALCKTKSCKNYSLFIYLLSS